MKKDCDTVLFRDKKDAKDKLNKAMDELNKELLCNLNMKVNNTIEDFIVETVTDGCLDKTIEVNVQKILEALKKQIPKKPDFDGDGYADGEMVYDIWLCPACGAEYEVEYDRYDYCPNCGQRIDWTEERGESHDDND